jgi:sporulation protein YlmC with PRC-barrel domain
MKISDDNLTGRVVISGDGIAIGEITRLFVDSASWRVESLQIALRKESAERIGIKHSMFHAATIEISVGLVQSVGDAVVLSVELSALRGPEATPPEPAAPPP